MAPVDNSVRTNSVGGSVLVANESQDDVITSTLDDLLERCLVHRKVEVDIIRETVKETLKAKCATGSLGELENQWYASLPVPDYSVYANDLYIAEAWCCWWIYSRKYLKTINAPGSFTPNKSVCDVLKPARYLVDLGCGYGHTAAAWKAMLPDTEVIGTNVPSTLQMEVAQQMGVDYGFTMESELFECDADIVFASEYFEHIADPITHLREMVSMMDPKYILTANAFGQQAIGHFLEYQVGSVTYAASQMNRVFPFAMNRLGYKRVKTRMWNQRPALWARG